MDISSTLWSHVLGLFRCRRVVKEQAREDAQDEGYQHSALYSGPSFEYISAQRLNELSETLSVSDFEIGDMRIVQEIIPEHGKDTETFYLLQQEIRNTKKFPGTDWPIQIMWFKHYKISWGEMVRTRIGKKLLVKWGLKHPAFEVFGERFPQDDAFDSS